MEFKHEYMKISNTSLNRLTRWESFQFIDDVLSYADAHTDGMPELYTNKLAELTTAFEIFDEALVQEAKTASKALIAAEESRDFAVGKIYSICREYADYRFDTDKEEAANVVLSLFKPYGTGYEIARMAQDTESAVITNLLQDLTGEAGGESISKLNLADALDYLESANLQFMRQQRDRRQDKSEFVPGVVKTARADAQAQMMGFADVVNALTIVEGEAKYATLKQKINTLLSDYVARAKQRTKKTEEEAPEEVEQ